MLTEKETFDAYEVQSYFDDRAILNYLNELVVSALATFEKFLLETGKIRESFFKEAVPYDARQVPHLYTAKRIMKFVNMDSIYF